jgi:branched-chain amino acid transport system substrate-binding protein
VLTTQPDIDYDGISGSVNLDENGDPERGGYSVVAYNSENKYARQSFVVG